MALPDTGYWCVALSWLIFTLHANIIHSLAQSVAIAKS